MSVGIKLVAVVRNLANRESHRWCVEAACVVIVIALVAFISSTFSVLPDGDFQFFHEPAINLVREGRLTSYGLRCIYGDAATVFDYYVPVYFIFWALVYSAIGINLSAFIVGTALIQVTSIVGMYAFVIGSVEKKHSNRHQWLMTAVLWTGCAIPFVAPLHAHPHTLATALALVAGALAVRIRAGGAVLAVASGVIYAFAFLTSPLPAAIGIILALYIVVRRSIFREGLLLAAAAVTLTVLFLAIWGVVLPGSIDSIVGHALRHMPILGALTESSESVVDSFYQEKETFEAHLQEAYRLLRFVPAIGLAIWLSRQKSQDMMLVAVVGIVIVLLSVVSAVNPRYIIACIFIVVFVILRGLATSSINLGKAITVTLCICMLSYSDVKKLAAIVVSNSGHSYEEAIHIIERQESETGDVANSVYYFIGDNAGVQFGNYEYCFYAIKSGNFLPKSIFLTKFFYFRDRDWLESNYDLIQAPGDGVRQIDSPLTRLHYPVDARPYVLIRRGAK